MSLVTVFLVVVRSAYGVLGHEFDVRKRSWEPQTMFFKPVRALRAHGRRSAVLLPPPERACLRSNSSPAAPEVPLQNHDCDP